MDVSEADSYEQQLRSVFESFDSNNVGSLDLTGLQQLCEQLPLDPEQSASLMSALVQDANTRVCFSQFWDGLLNLLGGGWGSSCIQGASSEKGKDSKITTEREESPEREVSPKLVLGQKKYGRRSRPDSSELESESASESAATQQNLAENEAEERLEDPVFGESSSSDDEKNDAGCQNPKKRRTSNNYAVSSRGGLTSSSMHGLNVPGSLCQAENCLKLAWLQYGKNGYVNKSELEQVCECIGIERLSNEAMLQLFEQLDSDKDGKVSLDDFLLLFRSGVPSTSVGQVDSQASWVVGTSAVSGGSSLNLCEINSDGMASADAIIEMWDGVGVANSCLLLRDLNFDESQPLNVSTVASLIEEEIARHTKSDSVTSLSTPASSQGSYTSNLLLAALTLRQAEVKWTKSSMEQIAFERDKLRNDLAEANYRASLLAQEIDEHHSKLEKVSQNQFKVLEQKHTEALRDLTVRFSQEREQLTQLNNRLEQQLMILQQSESKLASDLTSLRIENELLEQESRSLSERISECEETKLQMGRELEEMGNLQQRLNELQASQDQDRIDHLLDQISKLRDENSSLRDRNDELTVELEVISTRLANMRTKRQASSSVDGSLVGATKRRGNSSLAVQPADFSGEEESPRVGKVRRFSQKGEVSLDNVHIEGLQIHPLRANELTIEADLDGDDLDSLARGSVVKHAEDKLHKSKWQNLSSETSSLAGSEDDLPNLPGGDQTANENVVARLYARIAELEQALHQQTCNFVGTPDVKHSDFQGLREVETGAFYLSEEDTPTSSMETYGAEILAIAHEDRTTLNQLTAFSPAKDISNATGRAVKQLEQHCRDLETQLDHVKVQIVKILSEKRACSQENCILKKRISDLLPDSGSDKNVDASDRKRVCPETMNNVVNLPETQDINNTGQNFILKVDKSVSTSDEMLTLNNNSKSSDNEKLHNVGGSLASKSEFQALKERCEDLEKSLAMMRDEYERCEDYWAGKLDEERHIAEQEQQITDEKFSELMSKIREYEELFADDHIRRSNKHLDGRLETIEEQDGLEKQVTELEEELEDVRCQAEMKLAVKDREIQFLKEQVQLSQQSNLSENVAVCCTDIAVQVSDLETGSGGSDRTFIVEPRGLVNENFNKPGLPEPIGNGKITDNLLSSSSSMSSSSDSPALHTSGGARDPHAGVVRHHQPNGRHRRIRHHPHYNALNCLNPQDELQAVGLRLHEQEQTCIRLQRALRAQQQQTQALLHYYWERHKQEVADLQVVLQCTQEKLEQQSDVCRDQINRLAQTDILVKELYVENAHLLSSVQNLEERCLLLLQQQATFASRESCSSV